MKFYKEENVYLYTLLFKRDKKRTDCPVDVCTGLMDLLLCSLRVTLLNVVAETILRPLSRLHVEGFSWRGR